MRRVETAEGDLVDQGMGSAMRSPQRQRLVLDPLIDPTTPEVERERLHKVLKLLEQASFEKKQDLYAVLDLISNTQKGGSKALSQEMLSKIPLNTSLQLACIFGDMNLVRALVTRGHQLDATLIDPDSFARGRSALSISAEMGFTEICEYLIEQGADVENLMDPPLRMAAASSNGGTAKLLIEKGADPDPILHGLLWPSTAPRSIKLLLEAGASPNGHMLLTALWRGCGYQVILALLLAGCPFRCDTETASALEVALGQGASQEVVKLLVKSAPTWTPARHKFFPSSFQQVGKELALCNHRAGNLKLPSRVVQLILYWTSIAQKRADDWDDLSAVLQARYTMEVIQQRIETLYKARYALESLKPEHMLTVLYYQPPKQRYVAPVQVKKRVAVVVEEEEDDEEHLELDNDDDDDQFVRRRKKKKKKKRPLAQSSGSLSISTTTATNEKRTKVDPMERRQRAAQTVAQAQIGNLNKSTASHCSCCHCCHVSMKQRPRPVCACSRCNTIICKVCLEERWREDLWLISTKTPNWLCPKCTNTCVCKSCKSKRAASSA